MKLSIRKIGWFIIAIFFIVIIIVAIYQIRLNKNKLSPPIITFDKHSNILKWESVSNADYYIIKIYGTANGTIETETKSKEYNCSKYITTDKSRDYQFFVKAISYDSKYTESDWSKGIYYSLFITS